MEHDLVLTETGKSRVQGIPHQFATTQLIMQSVLELSLVVAAPSMVKSQCHSKCHDVTSEEEEAPAMLVTS